LTLLETPAKQKVIDYLINDGGPAVVHRETRELNSPLHSLQEKEL
jgi:hypothetical protein